jgi:hypothetical protein
MGQFAKEFLKLYKQYYPDSWQPNMADVNTPDGIEWVRINHQECYEQYEYFWNHYGTLKAGDKNLFASQQKPKLYQLHTEYKGEILQKFKGDDNVEEKNLNGGIRLSGSNPDAWNMLVNPSALNEWIDVVLEKDDFSSFDYDGDGYCDPLNFCLRGATGTAYIDHITVELRDPDTEPPVITYNGETVINTCIGRQFKLDISAYDAYYNEDLELEYIWSEGAMVDDKLVIGTHTCTARATDKAGNVSEIVLTVNVGEQDTEAPSIGPAPADIYAMAGSQVFIDIPVTDNVDDLVATLTWSDGALDAAGRLCAGEHTLTVTATDLSGNTSELVIAVHVLATRPTVGDVIQDY